MKKGVLPLSYFIDENTPETVGFNWAWRQLQPQTPYGQEVKRRAKPYLPGEEDRLTAEYDRMEALLGYRERYPQAFIRLTALFSGIKDIRPVLKRAEAGETLDDLDFFEIKKFLYIFQQLPTFPPLPGDPAPRDDALFALLDRDGRGTPAFYLADGYSPELRAARTTIHRLEQELRKVRQALTEEVKKATGFALPPEGALKISLFDKEALSRLRACPLLKEGERAGGQVTFSLCPDETMAALQAEFAAAKAQEKQEKEKVRLALTRQLLKHQDLLLNMARWLGETDFRMAKILLAAKWKAIRPQIVPELMISVVNGIHPQVAEILRREGRTFTPVSVELRQGVAVLTGANMGGKSVSLKLIGLLAAMAQHGLYVPAGSFVCGLFSTLYYSGGDRESFAQGLSTFGAELKGLVPALHQSGALLLIDELGRGTNPHEGRALLIALGQYLRERRVAALLTTHFDGVAEKIGVPRWQVRGLTQIPKNAADWQQHMDYRIYRVEPGTPLPQEALRVAEWLGLPPSIIAAAQQIMQGKEVGMHGKEAESQ